MGHYTLIVIVKTYLYFQQLKLDEKKENTNEPINGSSVLNAVSGNAALNAGRLPRALHEELALILKRIGTKEHNKQALEQLYDLRVS